MCLILIQSHKVHLGVGQPPVDPLGFHQAHPLHLHRAGGQRFGEGFEVKPLGQQHLPAQGKVGGKRPFFQRKSLLGKGLLHLSGQRGEVGIFAHTGPQDIPAVPPEAADPLHRHRKGGPVRSTE